MHTNRILTIAVAAALSSPTISYAAGSFINVGPDPKVSVGVGGGNILTGSSPSFHPNADFDIDTALVVVTGDETEGIKYASELFGGGSPSELPTDNYAAVLYTLDTTGIDLTFDVTFTLSDGANFAGDPKLGIADSGGDWNAAISGPREGGNGDSKAVFEIKASETDKSLSDQDQLMLLYQIKDAEVLAEGNSIEMTIHLQERYNGALVNPERKVQIATAEPALSTVDLRGEDGGTIYISVADDSKLFTTKDDAGSDGGAYVGAQTAKIGLLKIKETTDVVSSDGITSFKLGGTPTELATEGSKLEITGGQFAASLKTPGKVELVNLSNNSVVATATVSDENTATFELTDAILDDIASDVDQEIGIYLTVDTETTINTVENPPQASLLIDFVEDNLLDIQKDAVELRQIKKDGTVCVIYNVPHKDARDTGNIRITNDSSIDGTILAKMYALDGTAIGPAEGIVLNNGENLGAGKTFYIDSAGLSDAGFAWDRVAKGGRAIMELTSTLPKLEVLLLLRNMAPGSPLTNLSVGASGSGCSQ
jgi:hypothetical protein